MVSALLTLFFMVIVQMALVLHVRNMLIDSAASAARYGTLADRNEDDAVLRAAELLNSSLGSGYAENISASWQDAPGRRTLIIRVVAPLPVLGLWGPADGLSVEGRSVKF